MATAEEIKGYSAYQLATLADCGAPDESESIGAAFLLNVRDEVVQRHTDGTWDESAQHEIADGAPSVYTHKRWQEFLDLTAYQEEPEASDEWPSDLTEAAGVALYQIADRLVSALTAELEEEEEEDDESAAADV